MSETQGFGDLLGRYVGRLDPGGKRFQARAVTAWNEVVGAEIRKHTRGLALREGELVVHVDSPTWATELSLMADRVRRELNEKIGEELVSSVRFSVSKRVKREEAWDQQRQAEEAFYEEDKVEPIPLNAIEREQVLFCARGIADESLREAAVRAMTKDLEWKKALKARNESQRGSEGPDKADSQAE